MYTIIGGDGKEYGPVSAEQVRAWVSGGRANAGTKVKAEGAAEWKTVADFPELLTPPVGAVAAPGVDREFDVISCYSRAWELLRANFLQIVGISTLVLLIAVAVSFVPFASIFVVTPLTGGLYYFMLLKIRGQAAGPGDAFSGFSRAYLNLLVAGLLVGIFSAVGMLLLILPGIYLMVAYVFTQPLCVDRQIGFWDAMELSRKTATKKWWQLFGLLLLGIPINILGLVALGVGVLVTIPLSLLALMFAYEDLFNPKA
jgi:uncharacterized membrane protein